MPSRAPKNSLAGLRFVRATTWTEVYREWWRQEGRQPAWRSYLRRHGYDSWRAWREEVVLKPFRLRQRAWKIYTVTDPSAVVDWHGGPFPSWQKDHYRGAQTRSFAWLAKRGNVYRREKIKKPRPIPTTMRLFGLRYKNRIIILDGMHRCCKIALAITSGKKVTTKITIALAETTKLPKLKRTLV